MGNTRNFTFTFMVLVLLALLASMNVQKAATHPAVSSRQDTQIEMTVENAVTTLENVSAEHKQVMLQIMDTSSDN